MNYFVRNHPLNIRLQIPICLYGREGGAKLCKDCGRSWTLWGWQNHWSLSLILVQTTYVTPTSWTSGVDIIQFAGFILTNTPGIHAVVLIQILLRGSRWRPRRGQRLNAEYNKAVDLTNNFLLNQCYQNTLPGLKFFKLRKLTLHLDHHLCQGRDSFKWRRYGQISPELQGWPVGGTQQRTFCIVTFSLGWSRKLVGVVRGWDGPDPGQFK